MTEGRLQEKQFELVLKNMERLTEELELIRRRLDAMESLPAMAHEVGRLSSAIESLAYAALGRDGPHVSGRRR